MMEFEGLPQWILQRHMLCICVWIVTHNPNTIQNVSTPESPSLKVERVNYSFLDFLRA